VTGSSIRLQAYSIDASDISSHSNSDNPSRRLQPTG
jgi:hypothetical protein